MADINVERKGPSIWPWIIGLLVLALLIWAIAEMVDTDEPEVAEVTEVERPVAAVPTPAPEPGIAGAPAISNLMPLDAQDEGQMVSVSGQIVGQPVDDGFWILTDENDVLFVRSDREVTSGQNVTLTGTVRTSQSGDAQEWMSGAQLQQAEDWNLHTSMHVEETDAAMQPGMQPGTQPGTTTPDTPNTMREGQTQPGDTVQGRY